MSTSQDHAYGVLYTPTTVSAPSLSRAIDLPTVDNVSLLDNLGIRFIRIQWLSLTNVLHYRILPRAYFAKLLASSRPGVSLTKVTLGLVGLTVADWRGFSAVGEDLYVPDLTSFRICTYAPGHACLMGYFQEKTPSPVHGLTVPICPRTLLKRIVEEAERKANAAFLVGVESEFVLLRPGNSEVAPGYEAVNSADWSTSAKFPTGTTEAIVLDEMVVALMDGGIEVQMYHAEAAPGQYEIATGPLSPLQAADALVFTHETIRNIAAKHGLRVTFAPKLYSDSCGSGAHMHISMHPAHQTPVSPTSPSTSTSRRLDTPLAPTLTPTERSFLQGVLTHLPALCALTLPTPASYQRMKDGIWSGGTYVSWGADNREAPVRLCGSRKGGGHHFEVRCVDATSNAYVALAGILGAGARAIERGEQLKMGDCRRPVAVMSEEERRAVGVVGAVRLPQTVDQARELLRESDSLREILGSDFVEAYTSLNETLCKVLGDSVPQLLRFY